MGKFTKRLVPAFAALIAMAAGASASSILIDDFSGGSNENQMGHYWYFYTNLATKGATGYTTVNEWNNGVLRAQNYGACATDLREEITSAAGSKGTLGTSNYELLFKPVTQGGRTGPNAAALRFKNLNGPAGVCYPAVGMGTNLTKSPNPNRPDDPPQKRIGDIFDGVTHITFWAKVNHKDMLPGIVRFKIETEKMLEHIDEPGAAVNAVANSKKLSQAAYWAPLRFEKENEWQFFEIQISGPTNYTTLSSPGGNTNPFPAEVCRTDIGDCQGMGPVGDLVRDSWESHEQHRFAFEIKDAVKIAWYVQGQNWTTPEDFTAELIIDQVEAKGGKWTRPGTCKSCIEEPVIPDKGVWALSDFDEEVFKPAPPAYAYLSQNALGGPWYAFSDEKDANAAKNAGQPSVVPSKITMGIWKDPQYLLDNSGNPCQEPGPNCTQGGEGLNLEGKAFTSETSISGVEDMKNVKPGYNSTNGALVAFKMGTGWLDALGEEIRGFVGIGTELSETKGGSFNASSPAAVPRSETMANINKPILGVWFMYRTQGMNNLVVSVIDKNASESSTLPAADRAGATYSVRIPGTGGLWKAGRVPFKMASGDTPGLAIPEWSSHTAPFDPTQIMEIQFRHSGNDGEGSIAIDNVYLYDADITAPIPVGVRHFSSSRAVGANSALRASYSRGSVNVNWSAPSNIASGKISLVNIKGATVASQPVKASGSKVAAKLATRGGLPTGMYFVRIDARDVNGKRVVQQVPIQIVK
jgi:hypothetical protein